ncbi:hypothetical protein [Paenibacillus protaetiae]|uniref:Aspartate/glutamate racemase family protein n=1 Tax=Paenibacillus protaetiae TaxID=2509456 RepID=A0A4P6ET27_9BACL|nr:hypothetical protein [Paenibacillus protaetiae]QAY65746.1 hypothetical protein ET464_04495 [Paenibacillus protaetiae]
MVKIGCLHAHYSNIPYLEAAAEGMDLIHFVDPGLINRVAAGMDLDKAKRKVHEQLHWIAGTGVEAIVITCTQYIALLDNEEEPVSSNLPVIAIDEPLFASICGNDGPQLFVFTNPATVKGTMDRLAAYARRHGRSGSLIQAHLIENVFELIMQGKKEQYDQAVAQELKQLLAGGAYKSISVAQLSMVDAAVLAECELAVTIGNPLQPLKEKLFSLYHK